MATEWVGAGVGSGAGVGVVVGHVTHLQAVHAAVCVACAGLNEDKASLFSQQVVQRSLASFLSSPVKPARCRVLCVDASF